MSLCFDDAVVGAGILGLAHAYHLAKRDRRVVVFERNLRAVGASVRNFGMLWPIGQPPGPMRRLALRSLEHWQELLHASGLWHAPVGSLHLAYRDDEAQVLQEFVSRAAENSVNCQLLGREQVLHHSPSVNPDGLIAGMWSPTETTVDPREVIRKLPSWLSERYGVQFQFVRAVTGYRQARVQVGGQEWTAERLWLCAGDDLRSLFPEAFLESGLIPCKLQMLRSRPYGDRWRLGPMLAGGLTLRHYNAFQHCPTLPALKARIATESPEFDRYGIHVMASQNGAGELIIGDSHEYGETIEPFDRIEIDELILRYLRTFLCPPDLQIAQRWHGVYVKHPAQPYFVARPAPGVTAVTGVGGAGMTLSFGLAEQVIREELGEP